MFDAVAEELIAGEELQIANFGKFCVRSVAERKMRNPRTGEEGITPPQKNAAFRAFKLLKNAVNRR
ncbi:MAG: HU family DNA-binding protein [Selenomonadaceae bacterium]|nr:HU family DNA-binding protein [Selenomonadaceae bacterium]